MCNQCGQKKDGRRPSYTTAKKGKKVTETAEKSVEFDESCKFCGQRHTGELEPYLDPFPEIPQFPREGIYGMHPIPSTCKRTIMDHMLTFQRELMAQAEKTKMRVKMLEYKAAGRQLDKNDPVTRVVNQLDQLDADVQQLKHELMVEGLRRKYGTHADTCPCYES